MAMAETTNQVESVEQASPMAALLLRYALITPARNEAKLIEATIRAVVAQTVPPARWVIVSDGSTDGTDEIVWRFAAQHPWIELLRMPERCERHFGGKAMAINAACERLAGVEYDAIACLDADITFEPDYFEYLLGQLASDRTLGLVGTPYKDVTNEVYDYRFVRVENVSGACQLFRRACFEDIGGYAVVKGGAIDTIASLTARMKGWKTRTFTGKICLHHREVGTAQGGTLKARFNLGKRDWAVGNHPLWEMFRGVYQLARKPYVVRGMALMAGYVSAAARGGDRPVSAELCAFRRREQMEHLRRVLTGGAGKSREGEANGS
jgi:glycosyltransferase involved in cell wall biosynthesis